MFIGGRWASIICFKGDPILTEGFPWTETHVNSFSHVYVLSLYPFVPLFHQCIIRAVDLRPPSLAIAQVGSNHVDLEPHHLLSTCRHFWEWRGCSIIISEAQPQTRMVSGKPGCLVSLPRLPLSIFTWKWRCEHSVLRKKKLWNNSGKYIKLEQIMWKR